MVPKNSVLKLLQVQRFVISHSLVFVRFFGGILFHSFFLVPFFSFFVFLVRSQLPFAFIISPHLFFYFGPPCLSFSLSYSCSVFRSVIRPSHFFLVCCSPSFNSWSFFLNRLFSFTHFTFVSLPSFFDIRLFLLPNRRLKPTRN